MRARTVLWAPWAAMFLSAALTYISLGPLSQRDVSVPPAGNVQASLVLLAAVVLGTAWKPILAVDMLLGLYVPLYFFAALGWVGNTILPYLAFSIAATLVATRAIKNATKLFSTRGVARLPATVLIGFLVVLSFAQWFRAADMRDAVNRLCDITAFFLLLWELPRWDEGSLREPTQAFVLGLAGSSVVVLSAELFRVERLGTSLQFNPDFLGYLAGAALLLVISNIIFANSRWIRLLLFPILATVLYFSGCRAAFYGALLTVVIVLWNERRFVGLALAGLLGLMGADLLFQGMKDPSGLAFRMVQPFMERFADASSRRDQIWTLLWDSRDKYWLAGIGLDNASQLTGGGGLFTHGFALGTHNVYLTFCVELGILGPTLFLTWQCWMMWFGAKYRSRMVLLLPLLVYFSVEGLFSGFSNISFLAFTLVLGFRARMQAQDSPIQIRRVNSYGKYETVRAS